MGIHESTDQGIENFGIFGRTVFGIFAGSVIHPHGCSMGSEQVGLAAEKFLNLWGNQVYNFISDCCNRRLLSAFTSAVQPDDQRDFLIRIHFRLVVNVRERNLRILVAVFFEPFTVDDAVSAVYVERLRRNGTIVSCNFRDLCHIVSDIDKYIKITVEFDDRADSFHDKTRQLQRQAGAVLARYTGFVRNVNVRNAASSVHRVIRFVAHKIRPYKILALGGCTGEDLVHDLLAKAQFGTQSLGQPILGPAEQVAAYTRANLMDYKNHHYLPRETVVALAGNYEPAQVQALMEKYFGTWQGGESALVVPKQQVLTGRRVVKEKDTEQLHICLGYPGFAYGTDDVYAVAVMNNVLGGAMSSRLFQRIREELGMAYSIYTYPNSYQGIGTYGIYAGISPKNGDKVLEEIDSELKRFLKDGMTDKEFRDSKTQLRSGYLMGLESSGSRMQAMGRSTLLNGHPTDHQKTIAAIEAVTPEMVMDVAHKVLTAEPCLAVAGKGAEKYAE